MTRLPVESWIVAPRWDIPPYELNTICPVTGETSGLEDHHIWRRSFMAVGRENRDLYWVEYVNPELPDDPRENAGTFVVKNRVNLSSEAHLRITTNRARLEYRGVELWYIEGAGWNEEEGNLVEEKKLDLNLRLMEGSEKVSKPRRAPKASTPEERKARVNYSIRTPAGEENVLPEWELALRSSSIIQNELYEIMDDPSQASSYWVWVTTAKLALGL